MASCIILLKSNIVHIKHRPYHKEQLQKMGYHCVIGVSPLNVKVALSSFWKKYEPMMPPLYKPQQIAARNGCIGFCKTTCRFFFLVINLPTNMKKSFIRKDDFFWGNRHHCAVRRWPNKSQRLLKRKLINYV